MDLARIMCSNDVERSPQLPKAPQQLRCVLPPVPLPTFNVESNDLPTLKDLPSDHSLKAIREFSTHQNTTSIMYQSALPSREELAKQDDDFFYRRVLPDLLIQRRHSKMILNPQPNDSHAQLNLPSVSKNQSRSNCILLPQIANAEDVRCGTNGLQTPQNRKDNRIPQYAPACKTRFGTSSAHSLGSRHKLDGSKSFICTVHDCTKIALSGKLCSMHGGGSRCSVEECGKLSVSNHRCRRHGGGIRCGIPNCPKAAQSGSRHCWNHGGGRRCKIEGCQKAVRKNNLCFQHYSTSVQVQYKEQQRNFNTGNPSRVDQ